MSIRSELAVSLDPQALAREPMQERGRVRFEAILKEAESILEKDGLSGFSIPVLAERLNITRGSVYSYFPSPHAVLNELALRYLKNLEEMFFERADELAGLSWRDAIVFVVEESVNFYTKLPVARLIILGVAVTDEGYSAQGVTAKRLGNLARGMLESKGLMLPDDPDVAALTTDIAVAFFRRSVSEHGRITKEYSDAAILAMQMYLGHYLGK